MADSLAAFHPLVRTWFEESFASPTGVQTASWPLLAGGGHALITAPTGSGKTLTAFLSSLDRLIRGELELGATRVLYVSPLKALNNDIQRNLLGPLGDLGETFHTAGEPFPAIRVLTRSGDTPQSDRQRMLRQPPEILITTPESLQLLLTTSRGRQALSTVSTLILDEIHSVVDSRRGVTLTTAVERLAWIAGEFQRIALSATVNPLQRVAQFVGGTTPEGRPREVAVVQADDEKHIRFRVRFPEEARHAAEQGIKIWDPLSQSFKDVIAGNTSTLFFTNSRRLAEKITFKINEREEIPLAYAHHGSLSREIRTEVESRLKAGEMKAIVATSSLEMGIDIGHLDEVVLVQSPPSIAQALQRIGRAGHRVGETSRGTLYPTNAHDFLEAAALARAIDDRDIEPLRPLKNPLDVLAQVIVSITATEDWDVDDLYRQVCCADPYRSLTRDQFDLVLEMLAGRYAGARVRDLTPRITLDRLAGRVRANKAAVLALYNSGGTIPDRGYFQLRHADTGAAIGELDEEFVWEASIGQTFTLGTQAWRVQRITHNDVLVRPAAPTMTAPPFWRAESSGRSYHYSNRIAELLEQFETLLAERKPDALSEILINQHGFDEPAAAELIDYLSRQRESTGTALPHRHHVVVELAEAGPGGYRGGDGEQQIILHTVWGGQVNRPLAIALEALWRRETDLEPEVHADDDAIVIQTKRAVDPLPLIETLAAGDITGLLREGLERTGFFGARFRECAGRALLLSKANFKHRRPLWMTRLKAKKLMTATSRYPDFPVLLETWRTCLKDEFDLEALEHVLDELSEGTIRMTSVHTAGPSPFAAAVAWTQINRYMYADDTPDSREPSSLTDELIAAAVFDARLRPRLKSAVVSGFVAKRQRTAPGYGFEDPDEAVEWLKERILLSETEWESLTGDQSPAQPHWLKRDAGRWATHPELAAHLTRTLLEIEPERSLPRIDDPRDAPQLLREVLSFFGPVSRQFLTAHLPLSETLLDDCLTTLVDEGALVLAPLLEDDETDYYCDAENLEILLRLQRAAARPRIDPITPEAWPAFVARWQRLGISATESALDETLTRLQGYAASVGVWLDDLLPSRHPDFADHQLDAIVAGQGVGWVGTGAEQITFGPSGEFGLVREPPQLSANDLFDDPRASYSFFQLADNANATLEEANTRLWSAIWDGAVTADTLTPLRHGQLRRYEISSAPTPRAPRRLRRGSVNTTGWPGTWHLPAYPEADEDPISALETDKERVRILIDRYGVMTRELANREGGVFAWRRLFRAFRVMELAGEVVAGLFVNGLSGPQFAHPAAVRQISRQKDTPSFWINATDPVSPCGLGFEWKDLPQRRAGNHLAFAAGTLAMVSEAYGKRITVNPSPSPEEQAIIVSCLQHLLKLRRRLAVETINNERATGHPFLEAIRDQVEVTADHRGVELRLTATQLS